MVSLNSFCLELKILCLDPIVQEPKDIKALVKMGLLSKEFNTAVGMIITEKMNSKKWSFEAIGLRDPKHALKFVQLFGAKLKYLDIGKESCLSQDIIQTYCPKICEVSKKLKEIEDGVSALSDNTQQQVNQIFKELSKSIIDTSKGVSYRFKSLGLPEEIMSHLSELDTMLYSQVWCDLKATKNLWRYFSQFGEEEKTPRRPTLFWKVAVNRLIEHLKTSESEQIIKILKKSDQRLIDMGQSIMIWFDGIKLSEDDIFHLSNLDRAIQKEVKRACSVDDKNSSENLSLFVKELKQKLSEDAAGIKLTAVST